MSNFMEMPGLVDPDERELITKVSKLVEDVFEKPNIVHIGVYMGASCYCSRVGSPHANIYGVDVTRYDLGLPEDLEKLQLHFIHGDSREVWKDFDLPVHMIFIDGEHSSSCVGSDIVNWVMPFVVPGGYAVFHDAFYEPEHTWYRLKGEVSGPIDKLLLPEMWEEQPKVDSVRWFRRLHD